MAELNMEELVSMYNEVLNHDKVDDDIRVFVFKDTDDLIKKYVEANLMEMKVSEPISGEKYEDTFNKYLQDINSLIKPFEDNEIIVVGVFGKYVDRIDIGNVDVRVYHVDEIDLLVEDIQDSYK